MISFQRRTFPLLIPDIVCFIDLFHCRTCSWLVFSYNRKILSTWKTLHSQKVFLLFHSTIFHFTSTLYNSPSQQNWKLLCLLKMFLQFFAHRVKQFLCQSMAREKNGKSWLTYTKLRFQPTEKTFWGHVLLGTAVMWYRLQVSSHVTFLLVFILFVSRQKSEKILDRCVHVFLFHSFCYWFYLCRIVLSMITIVYVEILQLCFIHFLQNRSWNYTVPSLPWCNLRSGVIFFIFYFASLFLWLERGKK